MSVPSFLSFPMSSLGPQKEWQACIGGNLEKLPAHVPSAWRMPMKEVPVQWFSPQGPRVESALLLHML